MGTNNGLSSIRSAWAEIPNFSAADGLPGTGSDGLGSVLSESFRRNVLRRFQRCYGFLSRSRIVSSSFVPTTVLTEFRLSGNPVSIGGGSPLKQSISHTDSITLSHQQNIFSIEFSALSFFNAETNRYRYKLDGLDNDWHQVGSDERIASYTTLAGSHLHL